MNIYDINLSTATSSRRCKGQHDLHREIPANTINVDFIGVHLKLNYCHVAGNMVEAFGV